MIARYCDRCGKLMDPQDSERLMVQEGDFRFEVIAKNGTARGDICHECVRTVIGTSPHLRKDGSEPPTVVLRVVPVIAVEKALDEAARAPFVRLTFKRGRGTAQVPVDQKDGWSVAQAIKARVMDQITKRDGFPDAAR